MTYIDEREHVFVLGSARSGTSLLSSILKNSPLYSTYRAETLLLYGCRSKYGDLADRKARARFWSDWFESRQFRRSGLSRDELAPVIENQRSYIGVLGSYMNLVAAKQGCPLWLDGTPSNAFCLPDIALSFPNARVIHIVRDGRAVAMSLARLGWTGVSTRDPDDALAFSALTWKSAVTAVMTSQELFGERFMQVSYEDMVLQPVNAMHRVTDFLGIPELDTSMLESDAARTGQSERSTLHTPNSPFGDMSSGISTSALYRWKDALSDDQIALIELHAGSTLERLGYTLQAESPPGVRERIAARYRSWRLEMQRYLKLHTPLGRLAGTPLEIGME